jgi:hypothetical protein
LAAQGWNTQDPNAVRYEVALPDSTRADDVLSKARSSGRVWTLAAAEE